MTTSRQPQMLTGVHQAVKYFLLAIFHASISIGTLESDLLSLSTPSRTKWTLIYLCNHDKMISVELSPYSFELIHIAID